MRKQLASLIIGIMVFGLIAPLFGSPASASGITWHTETVDSNGNAGYYSSLAFDSSGNPAISYFDYAEANLKYASWNGTSWAIQTVDSTVGVGQFSSLAFDQNWNASISYYDATNHHLKYACWNGTMWVGLADPTNPDTVDSTLGVGSYTSLAFDPLSKRPGISYYDAANAHLKYASWNGTMWVGLANPTNPDTVDSTLGVGSYTSLAFNPGSKQPAISYYDATNANLKYASWNGTNWDTIVIDTAGGVGTYSSLAFDALGYAGISYHSDTGTTASSPTVKYEITGTASTVNVTLNDGVGSVTNNNVSVPATYTYSSFAGDSLYIRAQNNGPSGTVTVSIYVNGNLFRTSTSSGAYVTATASGTNIPVVGLKYAHWDGSNWDTAVVDTGGVGAYSSLAFDPAGRPGISYFDSTNVKLKYTYWDGTKWRGVVDEAKPDIVDIVDNTVGVGYYISLAFDNNGNPSISYYDATNGYLKYATTASRTNSPPYRPSNIAPADGTKDISLTPILKSSDFSDPDTGDSCTASQWQVITSGSYSSTIFSYISNSTSTVDLPQISLPSGYLDYETTYYWQVRYQDFYGMWSDWSNQTSFTTVASLPPNQPSNLSPTNGETGVRLTMTLKSSPFSTPDGGTHTTSQWQITTTQGDYSSPMFNSTSTVDLTQISISSGLGYNTTYYWRVRYQDSYGIWSDWSNQTSFTTVISGAPYQPFNVRPADETNNISLTPILESSPFSDPDAGDTHTTSQWQVTITSEDYSSTVFDSYIDSLHLTQISLPSGCLGYGTTYYWRVKYQDSYGIWSDWSNQTSFTTVASLPPNQPINLSPLDGAAGVSFTPTLQSSDFFDPDGGTHTASQWQVTTTSGNYSSPVFDSGIDTTDLTEISLPSGRLNPNAIYYWWVRYQDSQSNWSPWSKETSFYTITILRPTANFSASATEIASGKETTFTDNSSGEINSWAWDFGDNTTVTWSTINRPPDGKLSHTYTTATTYNVSLTVYNLAWDNATTSNITVYTPPQASFSARTQVETGQVVTFNVTSSGEISSWRWTFGDGTTSTDPNPTHIYTEAGSYLIHLTVTGHGESATTSNVIKVVAPPGTGFSLWMIGAIVGGLIVIGGIVFLVRRRLAA